MGKRPFLVLQHGECVPLEGSYRIVEIQGKSYVLGENQAFACESPESARVQLERLMIEHDAHALTVEALEGLPADYDVVAQHE
jgi:hypothetical protein